MGWGQRALEFVPNPIKDLIVRGVNLVAGTGAEAIKDNRGEGTGKNANAQEGFQKKETKKEREVRIKQEELEQESEEESGEEDEWGGGGYVYNSDDSETQEL